MKGTIALVGGDEFRSGCEEMDAEILAAAGGAGVKTLIVPTAAAFENPARAADNGVRHFAALGADAAPLMALDREDARDAALVAELADARLAYLTGGNPAHLLDTLAGTPLLSAMLDLLERGGALAGSSAGAMVMGGWMSFRGWRRALGVVERVAALCHHERANASATRQTLASAPSEIETILGIDGRAGALMDANGWRAVGAGRVAAYSDGRRRSFESGESIDI